MAPKCSAFKFSAKTCRQNLRNFKFPAKIIHTKLGARNVQIYHNRFGAKNLKISNLAPKFSKFQIWRQNSQNFKSGAKTPEFSQIGAISSKICSNVSYLVQNPSRTTCKLSAHNLTMPSILPGTEVDSVTITFDHILSLSERHKNFVSSQPRCHGDRRQRTRPLSLRNARQLLDTKKNFFFFTKKRRHDGAQRGRQWRTTHDILFLFLKNPKLSIRHESRPAANF